MSDRNDTDRSQCFLLGVLASALMFHAHEYVVEGATVKAAFFLLIFAAVLWRASGVVLGTKEQP